eukprot:8519849-Pyramimonas_sp.AAC.1
MSKIQRGGRRCEEIGGVRREKGEEEEGDETLYETNRHGGTLWPVRHLAGRPRAGTGSDDWRVPRRC